MGPQGQRSDPVVQTLAEPEVHRIQPELTRLDLGKVEHIVDDRQQRVGRCLHGLEVAALFFRQVGVQGQLRHADHAVHRCADLVAHRGQKFAFGTPGGLRGDALFGLLKEPVHADQEPGQHTSVAQNLREMRQIEHRVEEPKRERHVPCLTYAANNE